MTRSRSPLLIGAGLLVALIMVAVLTGDRGSSTSGPALSPSSTSADGTRALVLLLQELGANVRVGDRLPDSNTHVALLLHDGLDDQATTQLENWVSAGNTLVVTDPESSLSAAPTGVGTNAVLPQRTCTIPELADVAEVRVDLPTSLHVATNATSCFGNGRDALVVRRRRGSGAIVSIGDSDIFTNDLLQQSDNSVLAARLLLPRDSSPVAVLDPNPPGSGRTTLGDLISDRVFQAIIQLGIAFVVYALWRSRRVGRPVVEPQPVAIAGSQFVQAVGGLHRRSRATDKAATTLRNDTRRLVCERYAIPANADTARVAELTAARTGLDRTMVAGALSDAPVLDEGTLVTLGHQLDTIRQEVLDGRTS